MFQRELCRNPDVATVAASPHRYLETHWWLMSAVLLGLPEPLFVGGRTYPGYGTAGDARRLMRELLHQNVPDFDAPASDRDLVFDGWEALCLSSGTPLFLEKSPQTLANWAAITLLLQWMECTSMKVRIVGLVRNPHGVLYSASKLFGSDPRTRQFAWMNTYKNLLALEKMLPASAYMRVRYEDLVHDPEAEFRRVTEFAGVPHHSETGAEIQTASEGKWRETPDYSLDLNLAVRQLAGAFGYDSEDLAVPAVKLYLEAVPAHSLRSRGQRWIARRRDRLVRPAYLRMRALLGWGS